MRLIEIKTWNEFHEKLKDIKGNEYVYVKILCKERKGKIEAVDLKKFKGTLEINFPDENKIYLMEISHPIDCSIREFFYNGDKACVTMNYHGTLKFGYHVIPKKTIAISNEQQLQKEMNKATENCDFVLKNNLLLKKSFKIKKQINAAGFKVLLSKNDMALAPYFINAQFVFYDDYLEVKKPEDLYMLENFFYGDVVVVLNSDLKNFIMRPINLSKFCGNLYILGNHFSLNNGRILVPSLSGGLIGELHPYANLYVENLGLEHLIFCGNKPNYCGTVLGMRTKSGYQSPEGRIVLKKCWAKNIKMPDSYFHTDVFVGDTSIDYDLEDVYSFQVFKNRKEIYPIKNDDNGLRLKK